MRPLHDDRSDISAASEEEDCDDRLILWAFGVVDHEEEGQAEVYDSTMGMATMTVPMLMVVMMTVVVTYLVVMLLGIVVAMTVKSLLLVVVVTAVVMLMMMRVVMARSTHVQLHSSPATAQTNRHADHIRDLPTPNYRLRARRPNIGALIVRIGFGVNYYFFIIVIRSPPQNPIQISEAPALKPLKGEAGELAEEALREGGIEIVCTTHRLLSSSFLGLPYRFLNMNHKKELLRSLWACSGCAILLYSTVIIVLWPYSTL